MRIPGQLHGVLGSEFSLGTEAIIGNTILQFILVYLN